MSSFKYPDKPPDTDTRHLNAPRNLNPTMPKLKLSNRMTDWRNHLRVVRLARQVATHVS